MVNLGGQENGKILSYPSTAEYAVPDALESKVIREIVQAINVVIADGFALYEKTKKFYLNLEGSHNPGHKLLFDEQADEIFASMDILAERMRQISVAPLRSISHSGELQSVENYNSDFRSLGEMIAELIANNQKVAASLKFALQICEKMCDLPIGMILQDILDKTEKRIQLLGEAAINI